MTSRVYSEKKARLQVVDDAFQKMDQLALLLRGQHFQPAGLDGVYGTVQFAQELETWPGNVASDQPTILGTPLATHKILRLEAIDQPGDAGGLFYHSFSDRQGGKALRAGAPQDSQHVVLLLS